jgi:hypothetical protein
VWENDYLDDPFLSIMAEIESQIRETLKLTKDDSQTSWVEKEPYAEYKEAVPTISKHLSSFKEKGIALLQSTRLGVCGVSADVGGFLFNTPELKDYKKLKQAKEAFKESLKDLIKDIPKDEKGNNRPLIIAIDELDRTRPEYAIRTLEVIKHFFDIDGLKFILAVDKKQLQNTVKQMFGQETETDCYLRKFVDLEWNLPAPDLARFVKVQLEAKQFKDVFLLHPTYSYCITDARIDVYTQNHRECLLEKVSATLVAFFEEERMSLRDLKNKEQKMSLRDIEKFLHYLIITLQNIPKDSLIIFEVLLELLYLNRKQTEVFQKTHQKLDEIITKKKSNPLNEIGLNNNQSYYRANLKPLYTESKAFRLERLFAILENREIEVLNCDFFKCEPATGLSYELKLNLAGKTLVDYYEAIQFAGNFNKDDSEAGTT